ncbi:glycosyltransferase [Vibrio cholerae]|nr:glycosyltransferase [Vibrio cholerae]EJY0884451.1 glycosyltransferase [Vibrio cholerae]BCN19536.1 putative glycosyltransferase [Vibrio cholerae]GHW83587.1 Putative teichuronic acid biosynthesis glycosyltransferase TuaG [Vibrio cholerae]
MIFTVVIVSYNRDKKLKESIKQLLSTSLDEIVVVDNNSSVSTRGILNELAMLDSRLSVIMLDENKGASFGFYTGLEYLENKYDRFITTFLDDDAFFGQVFLEELKKIHKRIGVDVSYIAPKVLNKNNVRLNMNRPMDFVPNTLTRSISFFRTRRRFGENSGFIEAASFIGLTILNGGGFKRSSLIPTDYFLYFDDLVFTYRLSKSMKLSGYYQDDLVVTHDVEDLGREFDEFRLSYILKNSKKFNNEIKGSLGIYPLLVTCYYLFVFSKKMKLNVFFKALFKRNSL